MDSKLPTVGVFAKQTETDTPKVLNSIKELNKEIKLKEVFHEISWHGLKKQTIVEFNSFITFFYSNVCDVVFITILV